MNVQGAAVFVVAAQMLVAGAACVTAPRQLPARTVGLALNWTAESCRVPARDRDADGVDDDCELALARAFAPELVADPRDCGWEAGIDGGRLGGGYLFAAESAPDSRALRVAYLPAYFRDCGWEGLPCLTRGADCAAHDGDSELLVVETRHDASSGRWTAVAVFLSAHCFGRSDGRCRWYVGSELRRFEWVRGVERSAPRIWVAKGKHANYPSRGDCDSGHWFYDTCDGNSVAYRFPVTSNLQNIGSRRRPLPEPGAARPRGCVGASQLLWAPTGADPLVHECFWDANAPFRGWQRRTRGVAPTPYARVLHFAAGF